MFLSNSNFLSKLVKDKGIQYFINWITAKSVLIKNEKKLEFDKNIFEI